jgi:WD40 repeat protein
VLFRQADETVMTCEWVEQHLSAFHDDALDSATAAQVREHVATCAHCAAILADYARFDALLARMPRVAPAPALRDHIFASPAFREIAQSQSENGSAPTSTKTPTKPILTRHMPQVARVWVTVLAVLVLISGFTLTIGRILASRSSGPTYVTCPHALASGDRIVFHTGDRLQSNNDALICDTKARVALWQASPDGQWIAYLDATTNTLRLVRSDAMNDHQVALPGSDDIQITKLVWSPDGKALAIVTLASATNTYTFLTVQPGDANAHVVDSISAPGGLVAGPVWSADDRSLAYAYLPTVGAVRSLIRIVDHISLTGATPASAGEVAASASIFYLGWTTGTSGSLSATHPALVFATGSSGLIEIDSLVRDGMRQKMVLNAAVVAFNPTTAQWVAALLSGTIVQIDAASNQQTPLAHIGPVAQLAWAPNGAQVAVVSNGTLWLVSAKGATRVGAIDATSALAWNPDSMLLAYISGGTAQIFSLPAGKATPSATQGVGTITGLLWSPDGHLLAIWGSQGTVLDDPDGMTTTAFNTPPADAPQWSAVP